ncbi:MAG: family peptidase [Candidatus Acidoferrum typicum]|nr:family peptidase [Candidatus Acidoferrum typicum]
MPQEIRVRARIVEEMLRHARSESRMECCGLLAGVDGVITKSFPAKNVLASPTAYEVAPQELFPLFRQMREKGLDHLGIYHSHPATENFPSPSDVELAAYPYQAYFIISPLAAAPNPVRAFSIRDGHVEELEIVIVNV